MTLCSLSNRKAFDSLAEGVEVKLDRPNLVEKERIFSMLRASATSRDRVRGLFG